MARTLLWIMVPASVVIGLAAAAPFFIPVSSFLPELSRLASDKLGQPVSIGSLSIHLLPTPRAVAKDLVVGKKTDAKIGELEIIPELLPLLAGEQRIRLVRAQDVTLRESAFSIPATMPKGGSGSVEIDHVVFRNVTLQHSKLQLPAFDVDARLDPRIGVRQAMVEAKDVMLQVDVTSTGERAADAVIQGRIYGGTVKINTRADWSKLWLVSGKAELAGVDVVPLQRMLGKKPQISGRLKGSAAFSGRAKKPEQFADVLALDGPFELVGGAYQGLDLTKAADLTGKVVAGDATPFEQFTGKLQVRAKRLRIDDLCVRSPKVVAGGNVEIAPDESLSGRLDVSIAKTGGFAGVPVALSGTASEPSIRPTRGYIIGAAVGTLLLPGIGTGIGASAGGSLEGKSSCK